MNHDYIEKLQKSCAFIPCYVKGIGKKTKLYYENGSFEYVDYSVNKIVKDYCAINLRCITSLKSVCRKITGRKSLIPLYIKEDVLLMPIKTVKPCIRGEGCIGYVNIECIKDVDFLNSTITLYSGQVIYYLERIETIKTRIADCTIIKGRLLI